MKKILILLTLLMFTNEIFAQDIKAVGGEFYNSGGLTIMGNVGLIGFSAAPGLVINQDTAISIEVLCSPLLTGWHLIPTIEHRIDRISLKTAIDVWQFETGMIAGIGWNFPTQEIIEEVGISKIDYGWNTIYLTYYLSVFTYSTNQYITNIKLFRDLYKNIGLEFRSSGFKLKL